METELQKRIVINQKVMVGKPVIRGTRIPVNTIVKLLAQGMTKEEILEDYPNLTGEDIRAALTYVAEIANGEDVFPLKD
ncbi:DUF433 domain-containing protein [Candidatus Pacearchaeota archaeon]|nr:DUF433 domain-containing protein [Candidatus Pacearchaeota archaeon]